MQRSRHWPLSMRGEDPGVRAVPHLPRCSRTAGRAPPRPRRSCTCPGCTTAEELHVRPEHVTAPARLTPRWPFCFAGSVSPAGNRRAAVSASHGQPERCPLKPALRKAGGDRVEDVSGRTHDVSIACHASPATAGPSSRRDTLCRSIDYMSTARSRPSRARLRDRPNSLSAAGSRPSTGDRRAVVARFSRQRLRLGEVGFEGAHPCTFAVGGRRRPAHESALHTMVLLVADRRLQEVLLVERRHDRLPHLQVCRTAWQLLKRGAYWCRRGFRSGERCWDRAGWAAGR